MTIVTRLELVAAVARNGVIGRNGQLAWRLPDDLRHFKELTLGHPVIMGRRTYESIGRPLPGRTSIVVSSTLTSPPADGVLLATNLEDAAQRAANAPAPAFVIGGAVLYAAAIPHVQVMHLTELDEPVEGDVFFPAYERSDWQLIDEVRHDRDENHPIPFRFCTYERRR